jgi:hypothetical protein
MRALAHWTGLLSLAVMLSGCTPAVYIDLYNATGGETTLVKDRLKQAITIARNTSADFSLFYLPGERLVIRTSRSLWRYSFQDFHVLPSLWQHGALGTMRAYAKIDSRGRIYLLGPLRNGESPHEIAQPTGFPVTPQKN